MPPIWTRLKIREWLASYPVEITYRPICAKPLPDRGPRLLLDQSKHIYFDNSLALGGRSRSRTGCHSRIIGVKIIAADHTNQDERNQNRG